MSKLEGNIIKYNYYKIFTKRVYLPLVVIFLIEQGGVTLEQIALIGSITAVAQFLMEIPSGYIADRFGHKNSLAFGAFVSAISVLPYLFFTNFWGGLVANVGFFVGMAFASGTLQAFMHETLLALGRDSEYSEIMGKGQSFGLFGNIILISLIPLTYTIHPKLPFFLGFICLLISFLIILSFQSPPARVAVAEVGYKRGVGEKIKHLMATVPVFRLFLVFLLFAVVSSSFDFAAMYREVVFQNAGIPAQFFGFLLAFGSLLAAIVGWYIHHLKKLKPTTFYLFDATYLVGACLLVGSTHNPILLVLAFALFPAYDRTRNIIFEAQVFEEFPYSHNKATLISVMNFMTLVCSVWTPMLLGIMATRVGLPAGYWYFGLAIAGILAPILIIHRLVARHHI